MIVSKEAFHMLLFLFLFRTGQIFEKGEPYVGIVPGAEAGRNYEYLLYNLLYAYTGFYGLCGKTAGQLLTEISPGNARKSAVQKIKKCLSLHDMRDIIHELVKKHACGWKDRCL